MLEIVSWLVAAGSAGVTGVRLKLPLAEPGSPAWLSATGSVNP